MGEEGAARRIPYLLDFYPLQDEAHTRIHPFFTHLKEGRLTTTKCKACGEVLWQPRVVCPHCNGVEMAWIDLPQEGTLYAFTEVRIGAPEGMEDDVPFAVGVVDLGDGLRVLARIDGASYEELAIGQRVRFRAIRLPDGRAWFRFEV